MKKFEIFLFKIIVFEFLVNILILKINLKKKKIFYKTSLYINRLQVCLETFIAESLDFKRKTWAK